MYARQEMTAEINGMPEMQLVNEFDYIFKIWSWFHLEMSK